MKSFFIYWLGPVSSAFLLLMVGLAIFAIATCSIGYMIPAMISGLLSMCFMRCEIGD